MPDSLRRMDVQERFRWMLILAAGLMGVSGSAFGDDTEALAKAAQNPIANMISLPFQNNTTLNAGPEKQTQNVLNIQPVLPVKLDKDWNLITRTILPVISQPPFAPDQDRVNGIGDTQVELFVSPGQPGKLIWGVGPILQIPTNSNAALGTKKWGIGPAAVLLTSEGHWLYGVVANNVWSFAGPDDAPPINQMLVQPFVNYNFAGGWYATALAGHHGQLEGVQQRPLDRAGRWRVRQDLQDRRPGDERPGASVLQRSEPGQRRRQLDDPGAVAVLVSGIKNARHGRQDLMGHRPGS